MRKDVLPAYGPALLIGAAAALGAFPLSDLLGRVPTGLSPNPDALQHVAAQLFFLAQPWHWPLLRVDRLDPPHGVNIALTDGIPLVAVLLKLLHLPGVRQGVGPFLGLAWALQPAAAVYALRGTGERRAVPCLAAALLACAMPTFLLRVHHAALDGHALLLVAIGLHLRAVSGRHRHATAGLAALVVLALFIHPYLMAMVAAVAAAVPLTLALRRATRAARAAATIGGGFALTIGAAWLFGYLGGESPGDYGIYSMNLAAPFWPATSRFLPGVSLDAMDATGGQSEGFQYLGAGLLVLLACVVARASGRGWLRACLRRHPGLAAVLAGLAAFAVSTHVFLLHHRLFAPNIVPPAGLAFRATGRFFWIDAYVLLLVGVRGVSLAWPARDGLLLAAAALQLLDTWTLREGVHVQEALAWRTLDPATTTLDAAIAGRRLLVLEPRVECDIVADAPSAMPVIFLAARRDIAVDTMYASRVEPANACDGRAPAASLAAGTLGVAYGPARATTAAIWARRGARCRVVGRYTLCAPDPP